jgi:hypothetical protein
MAICSFTLLVRLLWINVRQKAEHTTTEDYIMAAGDMVGSPLAASLDPRVDIEMVNEQMINPAEGAFDIMPESTDDEFDDTDEPAEYNTAYASIVSADNLIPEELDDEDVDNEIGRR